MKTIDQLKHIMLQLEEITKKPEQLNDGYHTFNELYNHRMQLKHIMLQLEKITEKPEQLNDGYHTFSELYNHRMILFSIIVNKHKNIAWKSKLHHDGTMFENYFIVGIDTPKGQFTYHYQLDNWDKFKCKELKKAPLYDGHTPDDIIRLLSI
jgi:hypothetical protein